MFSVPLGHTYQADRLSDNGDPIVSSIDHIYLSANLENYTQAFKLSNSSTDHVPIITKLKQTKNTNGNEGKKVTKRCMKNFSISSWNRALSEIDFYNSVN